MESVKINEKTFEIKNKLSFGQMKRLNKVFGDSFGIDELPDLSTLPTDEILKLKPKIEKRLELNDSQLQLMSDIIQFSLGCTDEQLETIPYDEATELFNKIVENSQPKKKPHQQYA